MVRFTCQRRLHETFVIALIFYCTCQMLAETSYIPARIKSPTIGVALMEYVKRLICRRGHNFEKRIELAPENC
jgi:hypothetical protein